MRDLREQMLTAGGYGAGGVDLRDADDELIEHRLFVMRAGVITEEILAGGQPYEADPGRDSNGG